MTSCMTRLMACFRSVDDPPPGNYASVNGDSPRSASDSSETTLFSCFARVLPNDADQKACMMLHKWRLAIRVAGVAGMLLIIMCLVAWQARNDGRVELTLTATQTIGDEAKGRGNGRDTTLLPPPNTRLRDTKARTA